MIKITNLNKVYRSKKRKKCHAIKGVDLTLGDNGLVFVLGKSGSGKSTLLNLIGGLDSVTSGKIIVNGNDLSSFSENDFCNYRNTHIGFIFQDYHLINEITIYENIAISLRLNNDIGEKEKVARALERVGLGGYETRYPQELSGGEQQRVAIARALVKNPRIILADEPTGNLDTATAKAVMDILKQLSRECLILIVSHNVKDAERYADRIIELASGEIISDKSRNPNFPNKLTVCKKTLLYPDNTALSDDDIDLINENSDKAIVKRTDKFVDTKPSNDKGRRAFISSKKLAFSHKLTLSSKFLKHKHFKILFSSFMIAVIMIIMSLAQTIMIFDGNAMIESEMKKANIDSVYLEKSLSDEIAALTDLNLRAEIGKNDIQKIKDAGYKGNVYPVYNVSVPISSCNNTIGFSASYFQNSLLIRESLGTMVVTEDFFVDKFGKVDYVAKLDEPKDYGIIITDYLADCILATNKNYAGKDYESIIGDYLPAGWSYASIFINAIIKTDYSKKHEALLEQMKRGEIKNVDDISNSAEFLSFMTDIYDSLAYSYSLAPNFAEIAYMTREFYSTGKLVFNDTLVYTPERPDYISIVELPLSKDLAPGEMSMSRTKYNEIFGTEYDATTANDFVPHTVKLTSYKIYDNEAQAPLFSFEIKITQLHSYSDLIILNPKGTKYYHEAIGKADTYPYSIYIDGAESIEEMLDIVDAENYTIQGHIVDGIRTMTKAVDVFVPIFELIAMIICLGVVLIMLSFASKMINDKMHDIGILKALGAKNSTIGSIFGIQVFLIAVFTSILSVAGYFFFIDLSNDVLFQSLKRLAPSQVVLDLDFLTFKPFIAVINCILTFILAILSLILPLIKIKRIKPVKIIKAKD